MTSYLADIKTTLEAKFTHQYAFVNGIRLHYVIGGKGDPIVLLHGWPHTWYQWHKVMPALAEHYTVIAVDIRGFGDSSKPATGYDSRTEAEDIYQLVHSLGFERIFLAGSDWGVPVNYAYASAHPEDVRRFVNLDATLPGFGWEDLAGYSSETSRQGGGIWHFNFNAVPDLPEALIAGRERIFISYFFNKFSYNPSGISEAEIDEYVRWYSAPGAVRSSLGLYRAIYESVQQNKENAKTKLKMPVLVLGASHGLGDRPIKAMQAVAEDVRGTVIEGCGHFIPEERPEYLIEQLLQFFGEDYKS
ncbi:alpha/beta hydrolase [Nostoc flagelliforme FACHB-838]|uniref:Alpha/beta hydrolase n=1 Tax=Nostoc flagelliforme FACHB-838 TaxID=2692904 RepID=A0ABR8DQN0_9NOSO|nr:alpha/beta hydrolase [Nostoc flagelliforme]MBD2531772.1 alpha/beta hydrolase [Nostoc flagelliforme FACHB-838]